MEIVFKETFQKDFKKLPPKIQDLFFKLSSILAQDHFHPALHTKPLSGKWNNFLSFRLTRNYRCILRIDRNTLTLYFIAHRKEAYR